MPVLLIIGQRDKTALAKGLASPELRKQMGNYPQLGIKTQKSIPNAELFIKRLIFLTQASCLELKENLTIHPIFLLLNDSLG